MFEGIDSIKVGTTGIGAAYVGTTLVYSGGTQPIDYSTKYFTTRSLADNNTITLTIPSGLSTSNLARMSYSTDDGNTWTTVNNVNNSVVTVSVSGLSSGDTLLWKGSGVRMNHKQDKKEASSVFSSTGNYEVEGNLMSLTLEDSFSATTSYTINSYHFDCLFHSSEFLVSAKNLIMPDKTNNHSMSRMFQSCTTLTTPPDVLPAETMSDQCYRCMFRLCSGLTSAPVLCATTMASTCFENMFDGCNSLTKAPDLLASNINVFGCYSYMLINCPNLNYIKCLSNAGNNPNNATNQWVTNVAANGTFVKKAGVSWSTGINGIPSGWTVVEEP